METKKSCFLPILLFLLVFTLVRKNELVKILGRGKLKAKLKISAHKFSDSAKNAIESLGGEAISL